MTDFAVVELAGRKAFVIVAHSSVGEGLLQSLCLTELRITGPRPQCSAV